jgi:hypothetical protein
MSEDRQPSILSQAIRLTHDAEMAKAEQGEPGIGFEATKERGEVSVSGEKGRLSGTAYVSSAWTSLKTLAVGVKGRWTFKKK